MLLFHVQIPKTAGVHHEDANIKLNSCRMSRNKDLAKAEGRVLVSRKKSKIYEQFPM
jgi:hypothetical protein